MARILVIDDEADIRGHFEMLLRILHHEPCLAANGREGLHAAADPSLRLAITDLGLPGSPSGIDLIRQLRTLRPDLPIVVITGYPTSEILEECAVLGVRDFLTKPFELSHISATITSLLDAPPPS